MSGCNDAIDSNQKNRTSSDDLIILSDQAELDRVEFAKWSVALDHLKNKPTVKDYHIVMQSKYSTYLENEDYDTIKIGLKLGIPDAYQSILDGYLSHSKNKCHTIFYTTILFNQDAYDPKILILDGAAKGSEELRQLLVHLYSTGDIFAKDEKKAEYWRRQLKSKKNPIDECERYSIGVRASD